MALSDYITPIYKGLDIFDHQLVGFIPAIPVDGRVSRLAKGKTMNVFKADVGDVADYSASMNFTDTDGDDTKIGSVPVEIEEVKTVTVSLDGEEEESVKQSIDYDSLMTQRFYKAFSKLRNYIEAYLANKCVIGASRATGTIGTVPFGTAGDLSDMAALARILDDNGADIDNRQLILNSASLESLRGKMNNLFKANEKGDDSFLRSGYLNIPLEGFNIWSSAGLKTHTAGAGSGYALSAAATENATSISVDTGTGTILAGDFITLAGDTNKYVVNTGITAPGAIEIGTPGLMAAAADNTAVTKGAAYLPNVALRPDAIAFGARAPYLYGGKDAGEHRIVQDPISKLPFDIALYYGHGKARMEVSIAYGAKVTDSNNIALLIQ